MSPLSPIAISSAVIIFLQLIVLINSPMINCLSLEDRVEKLTQDFVKIKDVLEMKDARLTELELKIKELNAENQQQQQEIVALQHQINEHPANPLHSIKFTIPPSSADSNKKTAVDATGMPKSCEDLSQIGHTLSGLYSVMGAKQVESVYCDFTKLPTDSGFQTLIGYVDVKSSPVYFYVQRRDNYNKTRTPIPFDYERLNVGGAMNLTSGKFTAPQDGTYAFSFTGMAWFPASSSRVLLGVAMHLNGNWIESGLADEAGTADQYETLSFQSTLNLKKGDEIWLEISHMSTRAYLRGTYFTHFSGFLLEENLSQSFSDL